MEIYIKKCNIQYLYHTTFIYNKKTYDYYNEISICNKNFTFPEVNDFPTRLDIMKFFTVTQNCNYLSPWLDYDGIFLRYETKKPLYLFDVIKYKKDFPSHSESEIEWLLTIMLRNQIDGYIDREDCIELCLFNAIDCVFDKYEIVESGKCDYDIAKEYEALKVSF